MLQVEGIDVFYGDAQALWNVSFKVEKGSIVALIGANGAGKSTVLNTISGINTVAGGGILFGGASLAGKKPEQVANIGIGHVPEGRRLFGGLTVRENLELGAYPPSARPYMAQTLDHVYAVFPKLKDRTSQLAATLSGGEQQMLAIGRSLMARPDLLMLDEPSLGLAPVVVKQMFEVIQMLNREGVTILLVEQNVYQTLDIADYAYVLQTGRLKMEGTGSTLLKDLDFQKAYLGTG